MIRSSSTRAIVAEFCRNSPTLINLSSGTRENRAIQRPLATLTPICNGETSPYIAGYVLSRTGRRTECRFDLREKRSAMAGTHHGRVWRSGSFSPAAAQDPSRNAARRRWRRRPSCRPTSAFQRTRSSCRGNILWMPRARSGDFPRASRSRESSRSFRIPVRDDGFARATCRWSAPRTGTR